MVGLMFKERWDMRYISLKRALVLCLLVILSANAQGFRRSSSSTTDIKSSETVTIKSSSSRSNGGGWNNGGAWNGGGNNTKSDGIPGTGNTVIRFMPSWTNTSAILLQDGKETIMTAVSNYCGWFQAKAERPAEGGFNVMFKQTIGNTYVTNEGPETVATGALPVGTEIALDTLQGDTLWIIGNPTDAPDVYATYPQRLGECPIRNISVMMFDWYHGNKGDGYFSTSGLADEKCSTNNNTWGGNNRRNNDDDEEPAEIPLKYCNGAKDLDPDFANSPYIYAYTVSNDFGSGGCNKRTAGMVEPTLGANGVPQRATNFPESCKLTQYIDLWFLPTEIAQDATGKKYYNNTCRDLELKLDDEGYWYGEKNSKSPEKGFFLSI